MTVLKAQIGIVLLSCTSFQNQDKTKLSSGYKSQCDVLENNVCGYLKNPALSLAAATLCKVQTASALL